MLHVKGTASRAHQTCSRRGWCPNARRRGRRARPRGARKRTAETEGGGESCVCAHSLSSSVLSAFGFLPLAFGLLQLGGGGIGLLLRGDLLLPLQDAAEPGYEQIEPV
jgi:hypothetical protein